MKKILFFALIASLSILTSCKKDEVETPTTSKDAIELNKFTALSEDHAALYLGAGKLLSVDNENEQIAYSEDRTIYMVSDMESSKYYQLTLDGKLKKGESVKVDYISEGIENLPAEENLTMKVVKVAQIDKQIWLWDSKSHKGFILYFEPIE